MSEKYWVEKGRTYLKEFNKKTIVQRIRYWIQKQVIIGQLYMMKGDVDIRRILDAGCGFGRITRILCDVFKYARIVGIDISEDQLRDARRMLPRVQFRNRSVLCQVKVLNDLAVAVELLMHIEPGEPIERAVKFLAGPSTEFILTVDWWTMDREEIKAGKDAGFCYLHNYGKLFSDAGFYRVKEKKIPFVKQKIRVWRRRGNDE